MELSSDGSHALEIAIIQYLDEAHAESVKEQARRDEWEKSINRDIRLLWRKFGGEDEPELYTEQERDEFAARVLAHNGDLSHWAANEIVFRFKEKHGK